jgi:hypothetical protein
MMRNILGGLFGFLSGTFLSIWLVTSTTPDYPAEIAILWPILVGGDLLHSLALLQANPIIMISIWVVVGVIISPFSTSRWNTIRTSMWMGVIVALTTISSSLLQDPSIWMGDMDARNVFLVSEFAVSLLLAQLSLFSAVPLSEVITNRRKEQDPPIPEEIRTVCECGAVFKSKPVLCAYCGRELNYGNE